MRSSPFIVYVDESGDQGLANFDPSYPVFTLCAAVYERKDYLSHDLPAITDIKFRHWWHDAVVFHSYKIRKKVGQFSSLAERKNCDDFMDSLVDFFKNSTATVIAAAIDKPALKRQYVAPADPYELAVAFVLERTFHCIRGRCKEGENTMFVFEKRGKRDDQRTEARFNKIINGENAVGAKFPFMISFAGKDENIAGLQVSDLAAYSIARFVETKREDRKDWASLRHLIRSDGRGKIEGYGLKVFP